MSKDIEKKLVPKLRFPEFEYGGSWEVKQVNDYFNVGSSKRVLQDDWTNFGVPFYRTRELVSLSKNERFKSEIFISQELFDEIANKYGLPNEGDFLVSGVGTLGIYYQVKKNDRFYFKDGNVIWFKKNKVINSDYFRYCFQSDFIQTQILAQSSASTVGTFTIQNASVTKFYIPKSTIEQQKIADCLSSLDDLITAENQKLDALKNHKKGLMQQLFPAEGEKAPKLRFPEFKNSGDWEDKLLEEVTIFLKGKGISKADVTKNGSQPCIRYGELYTTYSEIIHEVVSFTNVPTKDLILSESNDVIIPSSGETQDDIATASCVISKDIALGGDLNIIRSKINGVFMAYYLSHNKKKAISKMAQGNAVVHLYSNQLKKLRISFPASKIEQQKIADSLSSLDAQISIQSKKIDALKVHKKGLMQQLFPTIN